MVIFPISDGKLFSKSKSPRVGWKFFWEIGRVKWYRRGEELLRAKIIEGWRRLKKAMRKLVSLKIEGKIKIHF